MPDYGATDVVMVVILAAVALPWSSKAWTMFMYIIKKTTKWAFAYTIAVVIVAFLQYSSMYISMKSAGDAALNDVMFNTIRKIISWIVDLFYGPDPGATLAGETESEL